MNTTCNSTLEEMRILPGDEVLIAGALDFHNLARLVGASCTLVAVLMSLYLVWMHALHYTQPREQRHIIRLLFMVPVYAVSSFCQIQWYWHAIYFQVISDCYEAFAIASFALFCHYVAPDLHAQKAFFREMRPVRPWVMPFNWLAACCGRDRGPWRTPKSGLTWFNIIWIGIYHYCFIRVAITISAVAAQFFHRYCESSNRPVFGHIWPSPSPSPCSASCSSTCSCARPWPSTACCSRSSPSSSSSSSPSGRPRPSRSAPRRSTSSTPTRCSPTRTSRWASPRCCCASRWPASPSSTCGPSPTPPTPATPPPRRGPRPIRTAPRRRRASRTARPRAAGRWACSPSSTPSTCGTLSRPLAAACAGCCAASAAARTTPATSWTSTWPPCPPPMRAPPPGPPPPPHPGLRRGSPAGASAD